MLILGAGVAGCAAAIKAAEAGLSVTILEQEQVLQGRAGEVYHPSLPALLRQLGVEVASTELSTTSDGNFLLRNGLNRFNKLGQEIFPPALGQTVSEQWLQQLWARCRGLGVRILTGAERPVPILTSDGVAGIRSSKGEFHSSFVLDAAGGQHWLARQLRLPLVQKSPQLTSYSGVLQMATEPLDWSGSLHVGAWGWTWIMPLQRNLRHFTTVTFQSQRSWRELLPPGTADAALQGALKIHDVTWRHVMQPASHNYFIVGDAHAVVDPASSQGVIKALMSGMLASHFITQVVAGKISRHMAALNYSRSVATWFYSDMQKLKRLYAEFPHWHHCWEETKVI
jgi:flavin-dependent dehydrogenase